MTPSGNNDAPDTIVCRWHLRPDLQLHLNEEQTRYIGRVLRLRARDSLAVFNGDKGEFSATVASIAKTSAVIKLYGRSETTTESPLKVHLVQGVSRGERMDFVVQKATELGVKRISPVLTEHGVVKLDASRATKRRGHWQKIAESACEQSGRIRPPLIDTPMPLTSWLETRTEAADSDLILQPGAATPMTSVKKPQTKVCILIGPKGASATKKSRTPQSRDSCQFP